MRKNLPMGSAVRRGILVGLLLLLALRSSPAAAQEPEWDTRLPAVFPGYRQFAAVAYDSARQQLVLFGGMTLDGGLKWPMETWVWDGVSWTQKHPSTSPPGRSSHAMAYDEARGQVVLFGGGTLSRVDDTWVWDGTNWTQKTPPHKPPALSDHRMTYDSDRGVVILIGGSTGGDYTGGMWTWDGSDWTQLFPQVMPPRRYTSLAYDRQRGEAILFGGESGTETWAWAGTNWTQKTPSNSPEGSADSVIVYDQVRRKVILVGADQNGGGNHTWEWDGVNWVERLPQNRRPPNNLDLSLAYDAGRGEVVLYYTRDPSKVLIWPGTLVPMPQQARLDGLSSTSWSSGLFGSSVALSGDAAIVGAPNDAPPYPARPGNGEAFVFVRRANLWRQPARLVAADGAVGDGFGVSVTVMGNWAIVGAYNASGISGRQGAAYAFARSIGTDTWSQQLKMTSADGAPGDEFGTAVALYQDTVIIGARSAAVNGQSSQGAAYVFIRSGNTWTQQAKLVASDGAAFDRFGTAVSLYGDVAVVGANGASSSRGAAYVFTRSGNTWTQQAKLTASGGTNSDQFGTAVGVFFDTAVVGAIGASAGQGAAYIFTRNANAWTQQAKLVASEGVDWGGFGQSVSVAGGTVIVGQPNAPVSVPLSQGAAYVFSRVAGVWVQQPRLTTSAEMRSQNFGGAVALDGNTAIVGTTSYSPFRSHDGSALVFAVAVQDAFTDDPLFADVTLIKAIHITELRSRINDVRTARGLQLFNFSDPTLGTTLIRARHIQELRDALTDVYVAAGRSVPVYTNPTVGVGSAITAVDITELRYAYFAIK